MQPCDQNVGASKNGTGSLEPPFTSASNTGKLGAIVGSRLPGFTNHFHTERGFLLARTRFQEIKMFSCCVSFFFEDDQSRALTLFRKKGRHLKRKWAFLWSSNALRSSSWTADRHHGEWSRLRNRPQIRSNLAVAHPVTREKKEEHNNRGFL